MQQGIAPTPESIAEENELRAQKKKRKQEKKEKRKEKKKRREQETRTKSLPVELPAAPVAARVPILCVFYTTSITT